MACAQLCQIAASNEQLKESNNHSPRKNKVTYGGLLLRTAGYKAKAMGMPLECRHSNESSQVRAHGRVATKSTQREK